MKNMKLSTKLIGGFSIVAIITLLVGLNGWQTTNQVSDQLRKIADQTMPSVKNLLVFQKSETTIRVAIRTLLNPNINATDRRRQYENIARARDAYTKAGKVYEGLHNSSEEIALWKQFIPKWLAYREENTKFFKLTKELEKTGIPNPDKLLWEIERIRGDHYRLVTEVSKAILMKADFEGGEDPTQCALGNWINTYKSDNVQLNHALNAIVSPHVSFHMTVKKIKEMIRKGDVEAAIAAYTQELIPGSEDIMKVLHSVKIEADKAEHIFFLMNQQAMIYSYEKQQQALPMLDHLVEMNEREVEEARDFAEKAARHAKIFSITGMTLGVVIALTLGIWFSFLIIRPIRHIVKGLFEGADQVVDASRQVSEASQHLAEGTSEQAAAIEETSSSIEEMSSMTQQNASNSEQANVAMSETSRIVENAQISMNELIISMKEIFEASRHTQKIVKTIDEIAFQTNLLALNAAIEAARAGQAGAGFAVVADEVRSLAFLAKEAARNTTELIEGTVVKINAGVDIVSRSKDAFEKVAAEVHKAGERVKDITTASDEQAQGINLINKAISDVDIVTQQNAANSEECAASAEEMNAHAESMKMFAAELVALVEGS